MVNFLEMMTLLATKYFFNIREHIVPTVPQMLEVHNMCDYYFRALEESRFYDRLNLMYWKFILSGCTDERMTDPTFLIFLVTIFKDLLTRQSFRDTDAENSSLRILFQFFKPGQMDRAFRLIFYHLRLEQFRSLDWIRNVATGVFWRFPRNCGLTERRLYFGAWRLFVFFMTRPDQSREAFGFCQEMLKIGESHSLLAASQSGGAEYLSCAMVYDEAWAVFKTQAPKINSLFEMYEREDYHKYIMNDLQRELRNLKAHPQFIVCMPCHEIAKNIEGYMDFLTRDAALTNGEADPGVEPVAEPANGPADDMEGIEEPAQEPEDCEMNLDEDSPSNSSTNVFPPESSQQNSDENLASNCSQSSNLPNNSSETAHAIDLNTNNSSHTEITPENISHSAPSTSLPFCEPENLSGNFSESSRSTSQPEVLFEFTITPSNPTNGLFNVPIDSEIQSIINESILAQNIRFANLLSIPQVVANIIATAHEPLQLEPIPELGNVSLVLPNTESSSVEFSELFTTENILMPSSVYNGLDSVNSVVNPEFAVNAPVVDAPVVRYLHLRTIYEAFNEHLYHKIPFNGFDFTSLFPMIALSNQPNYEELVNPRPDPIFRQFLMTLSEPQREAAVRKFLVMDAVRRHMIDAVIRTIDQIPYFDRENHMLYDFAASMVLCLKSNEAEQIQYWLDLMANRGEEPAEPANN